jgi:endogenous inhibitor of DNA gyrase (YacG/DUF329 family)
MITTCEFCNKEYKTFENWYNRAKHHTCSKECSAELKKKLSEKTCGNCGKEYYKTSHQKTSKFCSQKCKSESDKKRIKLKCNTCNTEYEVVESRKENSKFCSTDCLREYTGYLASLRVGELNPTYKGFNDEKRTNKSKLKSWSRLILQRDIVCQKCEGTECLQAHHIKPYRDNIDLRFDMTNGILLCKYCHAKEHENDKVSVKHLILNNNVKKELDR